jgi:hypothetical protein
MKRLFALFLAALIAFPAAAQLNPFTPVSTASIAVTGTAQTLTLPLANTGMARQVVLSNVGTQTVFLVCDGINGTSPTTATTSNGMPMLANTQIVISLGAAVISCSVIASTTGSTLYATGGSGS